MANAFSTALSSLRDLASKLSSPFRLQSTFASHTVSNRPMTEAERKAFDAAFVKMDEAFAEINKAFKAMRP